MGGIEPGWLNSCDQVITTVSFLSCSFVVLRGIHMNILSSKKFFILLLTRTRMDELREKK